MNLDEAIMRFKSNAEYEREHGSPAYLNSEQLCKWLEELKELKEQQEDAISRAEVIKAASGYCHPSNIAKELAKLPPVQPKPKVGHWIMTNDYYTGAYGTIDYVKCSCCGEESLEEGDFCPNCGCRMIEPQAESEKA